MKKTVFFGIGMAAACVAVAQAEPLSPVRDPSALIAAGAHGFGLAIGTGRDARNATMDTLRTAAAKAAVNGCRNRVRVIALVDDSLSAGQLARYGWRIVTRIGEVATLSGCAESAPYLCALPGIKYVKMPSRAHPTMDSVRKLTHVNEVHKTIPGWTGPRLTGKGVLFGIIDSYFDTRHKAFLDSNGLTRFTALWDQLAAPADANKYGYGVIKNHAEILADSMFGLGSDSHGTLMASYAAGSEWSCPYYGMAPDVRIAAVNCGFSDQAVIDGLDWLFSLADSLGLPCVANMSFGGAEGPHDGTSLVDRAIDNVSATPGHIVVGAIGNDGAKREHVQLTVTRTSPKGTWMTPVRSGVSLYSLIDMWGDSGKTFTATFSILDTARMVSQPEVAVPTSMAPGTYGATFYWYDAGTGNRDTIQFLVVVTNRDPLNAKPHVEAQTIMTVHYPVLYFGVSVSVTGSIVDTVHAWNVYQRSFRSFGVTNYLDGDTVMSVNEQGGTAKRNITVGAYNSKVVYTLYNGNQAGYPPGDSSYHGLTGYTGRGPTVDGRVKPDITAPGSNPCGAMPRNDMDTGNCLWWPGWPDSLALEGRYKVTGGTSVSSPIVAGVVALMLEYKPTLTVEQARQIIQETAITDLATGAIPPYNNLWGAGKVNALGAVDRLINGSAVNSQKPPITEALPRYRLVRLSGNRLKFIGSAKGVAVELFSLSGRLLLRQVDKNVVSLAPLPQGIYFVRAAANGSVLCSNKVSVLY
jgi:minor extracellular serine protease Vpr